MLNQTTATKTLHSVTCARAFNRLDPSCPRCSELAAGSPARKGWGHRARPAWLKQAARTPHDCKAYSCGPVCTWGDW